MALIVIVLCGVGLGAASGVVDILGDEYPIDTTTTIRLHGRMLPGELPSEIGRLTKLKEISISGILTGTLPTEIAQLKELSDLILTTNFLEGTIPSQIGLMTRLSQIYLSHNQFKGYLPSQIALLTALKDLGIANNFLQGTIPTEIGKCSALEVLLFDQNRFVGNIPPEFGKLSNILMMGMKENKLSGQIPSEMYQLTQLSWWMFDSNNLRGTISPAIARLTEISDLSGSRNRMFGSIPSQIGLHSTLTYIMMNENELSGSIATQFGQLSELRYLSFFGNQLEGEIPSELARLTDLTTLMLQGNKLTGSISSEFAQLTDLIELVLSNNRLTGTIPTQLNSLTQLTLLDLSRNMLSGPHIPTAPQLFHLLLHNNRLTGEIPSQLSAMTNIQFVSLFHNRIRGTLPPINVPDSIVLAFDNMLSCELPSKSAKALFTLVALGNAFRLHKSGRVDADWMTASDTESRHLFEGYPRPWARQLILVTLISLIGFACWWAARRRTSLGTAGLDKLWRGCMQLSIGLGLFGVAYMGLLASAEHIHACADPLARVTLAEGTNFTAGLCAGIAICFVGHVLLSGVAVTWLSRRSRLAIRQTISKLPLAGEQQQQRAPQLRRKLLVVMGWFASICVLNTPALLHFMAMSFPANNSVGIRPSTLVALRWFMSPLLVLISEVIIPYLSNIFVVQYYGENTNVPSRLELSPSSADLLAYLASPLIDRVSLMGDKRLTPHESITLRRKKTTLILASQFIVLAVVPVLAQFLVHDKCMRLTRALWAPCDNANSALNLTIQQRLFIPAITVLTPEMVCKVAEIEVFDPQLCVRGIIATTSDLIISKVLAQTLIILLRTGVGMICRQNFRRDRCGQCCGRALRSFARWANAPLDEDTVTRSILSLMLSGFVYGGVAPLIWWAVVFGLGATILMWWCSIHRSLGEQQALSAIVSWRVVWSGVLFQAVLGLCFFVSAPCGDHR